MEQSPLQPTPVGAFRFNTDSSKLEYYDGNQWVNVTSDSPEVQTGGTRGCIAGGTTPTYLNTIEQVNIATTGNAADFGDLTATNAELSAVSSRTRGVFGSVGGSSVDISYITISSLGDAIDFGGDLTKKQLQYCANDVIYLHKIYEGLYKFLVRENRLELYNKTLKFLPTRVDLDFSSFNEDIWSH